MRIVATSAAILLGGISITACAATPHATLVLVNSSADLNGKEFDSYALPKTFVDLAKSSDGKDITVTARNMQIDDFRIALRPNDSFGIKTTLTLTKESNSDLLNEVGSAITDNRVEIITDTAKVATAVVSMLALDNQVNLPFSVDTQPLLRSLARSGSAADGTKPETWPTAAGQPSLKYWVGPIQPDAAPLSSQTLLQYKSGIAYAGCRELKLSFVASVQLDGVPTAKNFQKSVYVADANFVRYVAFPPKGKITVHPQCGTSVTTEKDDGSSTSLQIASALAQQAQAVNKAIADQKAADEKTRADAAAAAAKAGH